MPRPEPGDAGAFVERPDRAAARIAEASAVRPTARQLAWQRRELLGFLHFGMNTMTDREWGTGREDPALFAPVDLDADQWIDAFAAAGMGGAILTAKHHDGFCLWPTATTAHSVAASGWRDGRGDVVAEVAAACARRGLAFGVYLSPWDRAEPTYGSGAPYDDVVVAQLSELLTRYGPIADVWFDGACGEGPDGRVQRYDWGRYVDTVRRLQPEAVVSICGPDVRWCGNEAGHTRPDEWSVVPAPLLDAERTAALSQRTDDPSFARRARSDADDLGSRAAILAGDDPLVWYPAEVNTSIRPGWFHHSAEDDDVRGAEELFDIWTRSVGGNAVLLLNVPPTREGRIQEADVAALAGLGRRIRSFLGSELTARASGTDADRVLTWAAPVRLEALVLEEEIEHGQQAEDVELEAVLPSGERIRWGHVGSVGYRRIVRVPSDPVVEVRVRVRAPRGPVRMRVRAIGAEDPVGEAFVESGQESLRVR